MYANPQLPPEINNINVTKTHPLLEFFKDSATFILMIILFLGAMFLSFRYFVKYIPFSYEVKIANIVLEKKIINNQSNPVEIYLQDLANKLLTPINKDKEITLAIRLLDEKSLIPMPSMNAFATLGGNIFYGKELLCSLHSENAVAMVMAHEASHVVNRDAIRQMGPSLIVSVGLAFLTGGSDIASSSLYIKELIELKFSRIQETDADNDALAALKAHYGHTLGAEEFFDNILKIHDDHDVPAEILSTHPDTKARIQNIKATQTQYNNSQNSLTPLPQIIETYCKSENNNSKIDN